MPTKINKIHKYAAHWLQHQGLDNKSISKELKLSEDQVNTLLDTTTNKNTPPQKTTPKDLMITHTSSKKINSVAIMTKEASEIGDAVKHNTTSNKSSKGIFRPKQ